MTTKVDLGEAYGRTCAIPHRSEANQLGLSCDRIDGAGKIGLFYLMARARVRVCAMLEHQLAAKLVGVVGEDMMMIELK